MSIDGVLQNMQGLSYVELGMLRELIGKLLPREQWEAWRLERKPEFMSDCRAVADAFEKFADDL